MLLMSSHVLCMQEAQVQDHLGFEPAAVMHMWVAAEVALLYVVWVGLEVESAISARLLQWVIF